MSYSNDKSGSMRILSILSKEGISVHFCGVGGVSMRSLFFVSRHFGIACSGSDRGCADFISYLSDMGEDAFLGEREALPKSTALLVYSHAISPDNPERVYARKMRIAEVSRAEYLGALMHCYDFRIGVSGSHGKSTVTAMLAHILKSAHMNPTVLSGASLCESESPFYIGSLDFLVYESCEYRDSFLHFSPTVALFLNMELDHVDYFKDKEELSASFLKAMHTAEICVVNIDDAGLRELIMSESDIRAVTYGTSTNADYRYEIVSPEPMKMRFRLFFKNELLGEVSLGMLGTFNVSNAVAAIVGARLASLDFCEAAEAIGKFKPIARRLEHIGRYRGREVYYDYAHHPTEIKASVEALKAYTGGEITVIFRPHTYSRTKGLWDDFKKVFSEIDNVILTDISAIRENEISGVSSERLAFECGAVYASDAREILKNLELTKGDIIVMGAADLSDVIKFLKE